MNHGGWPELFIPILVLAACAPTDRPAPDAPTESGGTALARLADRIEELETRLAVRGRGAYRHGSTLAVGEDHDDTPLQRLHRLQIGLDGSRSRLDKLRTDLEGTRQKLAAARNENLEMKDTLALLDRAESKMHSAIQEAEVHRERLGTIEQQLTASELRRLRAEHAYLSLAEELIGMRLDETRQFIDLQRRLRGEVQEYRPERGLDSGRTAGGERP